MKAIICLDKLTGDIHIFKGMQKVVKSHNYGFLTRKGKQADYLFPGGPLADSFTISLHSKTWTILKKTGMTLTMSLDEELVNSVDREVTQQVSTA